MPRSVDRRHAVVAGGAGGEPGVRVGVVVVVVVAVGVGFLVGKDRAAIGGDLDLVAGDGGAAAAGGGEPGEVDLGGPAGRCREVDRGAGGDGGNGAADRPARQLQGLLFTAVVLVLHLHAERLAYVFRGQGVGRGVTGLS